MSRVHDAMRALEHKGVPEKSSGAVLSNLVGALIGELADEIPDDPNLEGVRADLSVASQSYATDMKKDLCLRFYLAIRALLRENALLQERLNKAERKPPVPDAPNPENRAPTVMEG
jgi:hypothetical protein